MHIDICIHAPFFWCIHTHISKRPATDQGWLENTHKNLYIKSHRFGYICMSMKLRHIYIQSDMIIHTYIMTCMHSHINNHIYTFTHILSHIFTHTCVITYTHSSIYVMSSHTYFHTYITYIHTHIYNHMYTILPWNRRAQHATLQPRRYT